MGGQNLDKAMGAIIGAFTGDASGAVLEFLPGKITLEVVTQAMAMPGGGILRVGPGQVTDDSELALSLARALLGQSPSDGFPSARVARAYHMWGASNPFDIGCTCSTAFRSRFDAVHEKDEELLRVMQAKALSSIASESNGALMRVSPLAVWSHRLPSEKIAEFARSDAKLSHPSQVCQDTSAAYCIAMASLISYPGDAERATASAMGWAKDHADPAVVQWLETALAAGAAAASEGEECIELDCSKQMGWVKWAFILSFYHLQRRTSFFQALKDTLMRGGDTDTNAAIVGGLVGAFHGFASIPPAMADAVINRDISKGHTRPSFLCTNDLPALCKNLYELAIQTN